MYKYAINNQQVQQSFWRLTDFFFYVKSLIDAGTLDNNTVTVQVNTIVGDQTNIPVYMDITIEFRLWQKNPSH